MQLRGRGQGRGYAVERERVRVCGREGEVGARSPGEIGMSVVRGGDVVGEHTVFYLGDGEQVEFDKEYNEQK